MKKLLAILLFFAAGQVQSQNVDKLSPLQRMEYYNVQIDSAMQERNVSKMAETYGKMVALCRETPDLEGKLPEYLFEYGTYSTYAGNHQAAIQAMIELLDIPDNPDDKSLYTLKARANMGLGMTYFFLEQWDNALVYYQKAREMALVLQNNLGVSIAENNIGNIYQKKENYQLAIEHYRRCLQLQEEIDDKETICNTYFNLGTCYIELGNFKESLYNFDLALNLAREIGDKEIEALCLIRLATYHAKEKRQFTEALKQIDQAERIAEETGHKQVLKEVYHIRSFVEEERGDFASALVYFKKYKILETDLFNEKTVNQLQEYEVRYQTAQKDLELERRQAEINQHKTRQTIFIGGLSIAVLVLLLLTVIIRNGKHRNRELAKNNAFKDKLFSIISHDLRNPATAQRNSLKLLIDNENKWDMPIICEAHKKLFKSADGLVELLQNLLNWAQLQTGRQSFHPLSFDLVKALQPDINVIQDVIERKNITFETEMPQYALVTGDKNMLATVVRNLLVNAVKFTSTGGEVSLRIDKDGEKYTVSVSDTGIGMSAEQIQHLFHIDRKQSHIGTAGEIGSGLGLIVCKELLEKHGSTLHIESEMEVGSRFWFEV